MSFDGFFEDFDALNDGFMKRIQRMFKEIKEATKNGKVKGKWEIKEIDRPGVKGYVIQGGFASRQPLGSFDPFNPFEPLDPTKRRPMPKRLFKLPETAMQEKREPLTDVFQEEDAIKIYIEMPGIDKTDIQLNVTKGNVEVKAKNFYKLIKLPTSSNDIEKASSRYRNGVLELTIPKKDGTPEEDTRTISID